MKALGTQESLKRITDKLDAGHNIYFTRFGDNDIMQISGTDLKGRSLAGRALGGNRTKFSKALQKELIESFLIKDSSFMKGLSLSYPVEDGMVDGLFKPFPYKKALEAKVKTITSETEFYNPVLFQYLFTFKPDIFDEFVDKYIRGTKILFIGCVDQEHVERVLGQVDYVRTPSKSAFDQMDKWWIEVLRKIEETDYDTIIPNCGQATRVIQKRLWEMNVNALSIDMGSIFDAVGAAMTEHDQFMTRTWIRMTYKKIQQRYE